MDCYFTASSDEIDKSTIYVDSKAIPRGMLSVQERSIGLPLSSRGALLGKGVDALRYAGAYANVCHVDVPVRDRTEADTRRNGLHVPAIHHIRHLPVKLHQLQNDYVQRCRQLEINNGVGANNLRSCKHN